MEWEEIPELRTTLTGARSGAENTANRQTAAPNTAAAAHNQISFPSVFISFFASIPNFIVRAKGRKRQVDLFHLSFFFKTESDGIAMDKRKK